MATVGCRHLTAIKWDETTKKYDKTPKTFEVVKSIDITPTTYESKNTYSDAVREVVTGLSSVEVAINTADLTPEEIMYFLGGTQDEATGVITFSVKDKPITCALMFESLLSDLENSRYTCIYLCKAQQPKESYKSKVENGVEFMDKQIVFTCIPDETGKYKAQIDSTNSKAAEAIKKWYEYPFGYEPEA